MKRENVSKSRKQNRLFFPLKASDCTLRVPNDYISILEIIKLVDGQAEENRSD